MDRGFRSGVAEEESKVADRDAIVRVALDYFEGWFDGDAARMERTLHPIWPSDPRTTLLPPGNWRSLRRGR
jgi:hypothetical protein